MVIRMMLRFSLVLILFITGCAAPMTAEDGIAILKQEYDPDLSRGADREKIAEVREFFVSNPSEAKSALLPHTAGENRDIQRFAIKTCAEALPDDSDVTTAAKILLKQKSGKTRFVAAEVLAERRFPGVESELVKFLKDKRASRRARAAMALGRGDFKNSAKAIAGLLDDRDIVTMYLPVEKHFLWIIWWGSCDYRSYPVREVALYSLSRFANDDFGWEPGGDVEALNAACNCASEWGTSKSSN